MANVENVEEMVGTREAKVAAVATESGGAVATESGGAVATTGDATAGDDTAAIGRVMYAVEGPYTIDVCHVEAVVGTTREAVNGDRVWRGRDRRSHGRDRRQDGGDRWRRLVTNETAATGDTVYGRRGVRI